MKKLLYVLTGMLIAVFASASRSFGGAITSTPSGGNWNVNGTWVGNHAPGGADDATIVAGATVTVTANASVHSVTFGNNSASTAVLTVNSGDNWIFSAGIVNQNSATTNTSASIQGAGTINCASLTAGGTTTPTPTGSDFTATMTSEHLKA